MYVDIWVCLSTFDPVWIGEQYLNLSIKDVHWKKNSSKFLSKAQNNFNIHALW